MASVPARRKASIDSMRHASASNQPWAPAALSIAYLATDVVGRDGHTELALQPVNDIQVGQTRLNHDDVGALREIRGDLMDGFFAVCRVHLIGAFVGAAEVFLGTNRFSEWPVKG